MEKANLLLESSLKALQTKIQLANDGAERSKNITAEEVNRQFVETCKDSESAILFWRDYVKVKESNIQTQKIAYYLAKFIGDYNNSVTEEKDKIKVDNLQMTLSALVDADNSG